MKNKWKCEECGNIFLTKRELVDHLRLEFEEADQIIATVQDQLESLGIKNLYE